AAAAWRAQLATLGGPARRFVAVRHDGGPLGAAAGFDLELRRDPDGVAVATASVNAAAGGDLEPAAAASPVGSLFAPPPGHHVAVRWAGDALTGSSLPVQALVGTRVSSPPGAFLRVPALAEPRATQLWPMTLIGALALLLEGVPAGFLSFFHRTAWNLVIDPTTGTDPAPTEGPVP
ncbi:MAG TPA: hypothetical protein VL242_22585, partial [Sorangium sp.]|nr:hypothetical protein [Sorangium sp.]